MSDIAIRVENLSKLYKIGARKNRHDTLRDHLAHGFKSLFSRNGRSSSLASQPSTLSGQQSAVSGHPSSVDGRSDTFWALKDVSFEIKHGEVIGFIGRNGAGKSTLLKILSRITQPSEGRGEIYGRVASLLEVGTGFHPDLSGRENIYLNGAILGMKKAEIERKFDEIVAFSEIEKFIDTPVKRYSSGMYVRLAFAVAAHLEPEILIVDEVLAVGDAAFQKKCLGKIEDTAQKGRTVLFVSHNMGAVSRLCGRVISLKNGNLQMDGLTEEVISKYLTDHASVEGQYFCKDGIANRGVDELKVFSVGVLNEHGEITSRVDVRKPFFVDVCYRINKRLPCFRIGFLLNTQYGVTIFETYDSDNEQYAGPREPGDYRIRCEVPANLLNSGRHVISVNAGIPGVRNLAFLEGVLTLNVENVDDASSFMHFKRQGIIRPKLKWQRKEV